MLAEDTLVDNSGTVLVVGATGAFNRSILLASLAAAAVALVLGALLYRQTTAPLRLLSNAARQVATGDLSVRVPQSGGDELAEMGIAFNSMAASLERQEILRRNLMADIAHELRTPLSVVQGQIEALIDGVFPMTVEQLGSG